MNMNKETLKRRDAILPELIALEKKHGQELAISAMRKRSEFVREESKRMKEIAKLEEELKAIRGKKERLEKR